MLAGQASSDPTQTRRRLSLVSATSSYRRAGGNATLRYGLALAVLVLLALTALAASPAAASTRITRPGEPRHLEAVAGDNSAIVTFAGPTTKGGSRVTDYYVEEYGRHSAIRRCDTTRCTILGLSNGVGYRFAVAAVNRVGRSSYSAPSNEVTPSAPVTSSPPLPSGTTATVTFNANGGYGSMANETESLNSVAALSSNDFVYPGYTFTGWNTSPTGSGTGYVNDAVYSFDASVTLYAQWIVATAFTGQVSSNWSGYVLPTTSLDTLASGEWTVPTLNCADTPNGSSSTWLGIGGVTWSNGSSSGTLLQTGVEDDCVNGAQVDSGWFEIYPSTPNYAETFSDFAVRPGDTIEAELGYVNGSWITALENLSTGLTGVFLVGDGWEVVTTATDASVGGLQGTAADTSYDGAYSVEWIEEDVTSADSGSLFTLPNYGSVTFFNLRTSLASWSLPDSDAYEIANGDDVPVSVPGPVSNDGFTVSYTGP